MNILEAKITVNQVALLVFALLIAAAFTYGAFATGTWSWLVAIPMNLVGALLVVAGGMRRRATEGSRGMGVSVLGGLLIVGSIWVAFLLGNAFPA